MMNKIITAILLVLSLMGCASLKTKKYSKLYEKESTYEVKETGQSPFVGTWDWVYDKPGVRNIRFFIGERNDSLMIGTSAVLNYGNWVSGASEDDKGKMIPEICIVNPKRGNTINAVYCPECSDYVANLFDSITVKLMNKNTLVFLATGGYNLGIPNQLVFKRENSENMEFSHKLDEIYKEIQK